MNFLQIVNHVRREADANGADLTTLAGTLTLSDRRFMNWVIEAWNEIQLLHDNWDFARLSFSSPLTDNVQTYAASALTPAITSLRRWKEDSFRIHTTGTYDDEQIVPFWNYNTFRDQYLFGSYRAQQNRPTVFTVDPQRRLLFGPVPTAGWTVEGEYYRGLQTLAVDADIPIMPEEFHQLIVYRAMLIDGEFEWADGARARAARGVKRLTAQLENEQLEGITQAVTTG